MSAYLNPAVHGGSPYASLADGLVAWYRLEEASGTRVDASGNTAGFDTLWGGSTDPGNRTGKNGNAIDFDGSQRRYIHRDSTGASNLSFSGDFSLSFWIYLDAWPSGTGEPLYRATSSSNGYRIELNSNASFGLGWRTEGGTLWSTTSRIGTGAWYHVYCYWDDSANEKGLKINNGTLLTSVAGTGANIPVYAHFLMGGDNLGASLNGGIDELAFWNRLLTDDEVTALQDAPTYSDL